MQQQEQRLHFIMDESDAPYESSEYARTLEDDLFLIQFAKKYELEFKPDSYLAKLAQTIKKT